MKPGSRLDILRRRVAALEKRMDELERLISTLATKDDLKAGLGEAIHAQHPDVDGLVYSSRLTGADVYRRSRQWAVPWANSVTGRARQCVGGYDWRRH